MAIVNLFEATDMSRLEIEEPAIEDATPTRITAIDGGEKEYFYGSFSYKDDELAGGTVTRYERFVGQSKTHEVSGVSVSATKVASYIIGEDAQGLFNFLLSGADTITGSSGNDVIRGYAGNDAINGGQGTDTAVYSGSRASYTVTKTASGYTVSGADGTDTLTNIERLRFSDTSVGFDDGGTGGQAYRLYQAAFNRTPDSGGLGYQINALETGLSITQVAQNFINSPEFAKTYGSLNTTQFVTQLYQNVLHRAPDAGGLAYHTGNLDSGANTRAQVLVGFSESPENQAALIGVIEKGFSFAPITG